VRRLKSSETQCCVTVLFPYTLLDHGLSETLETSPTIKLGIQEDLYLHQHHYVNQMWCRMCGRIFSCVWT